MESYLEWVRPLVDDQAFAATTAAAAEFQGEPGQGPRLQEMLTEYDKATSFKSYIEEFWNDACALPSAPHRPPAKLAGIDREFS